MSTKKPKINSADWRNLDVSLWNVRTFHAYFADMNRELYGASEYLPQQNWRFEQGVLRRAIDQHGAEILRQAFDECFRTYKPTAQYPILTAGFAVAYRINTIIPRLLAEQAAAERRKSAIAEADAQPLPEVVW